MNIERLKQVRDNIANVPETAFTMACIAAPADNIHYGTEWSLTFRQVEEGENPCGTAMCIAGRTCALFAPDITVLNGLRHAKELLGLTENQAAHLFLGNEGSFDLALITKEQTLAVLDHFIATGEISWQRAGVSTDVVDDGAYYED